MTSYIAFLRGINVGGNKRVSMDCLRKAFESLGFENVKTLLASGNVVFETRTSDARTLSETIEQKIKRTFELDVHVILRTRRDIQKLAHISFLKVV